jgi:hypothetical protein
MHATKKHSTISTLFVLFAAILLSLSMSLPHHVEAAEGIDSIYIPNRDGIAVFRLDLYGKDMPYIKFGSSPAAVSAADFPDAFKRDMVEGMLYWAEILKPHGTPNTVAIIRSAVQPNTSYNASAWFFPQVEPDDDEGRSAIWAALFGTGNNLYDFGVPGDPILGAHSLFVINDYPFGTAPNSNLQETKDTLAPTVIHEIGHALGILSTNTAFGDLLGDETEVGKPKEGHTFFWGDTAMSVFNDKDGEKCNQTDGCKPVPMAHYSTQEDSHFGVRNGLMTHGQLTNFVSFMEVELASLVDIGYDIDLRSHYGRSLYADNVDVEEFTNYRGFFESLGYGPDGAWLGYDESRPNTSLYGIGLHIYGSLWDVVQAADIRADGRGAAGIRVDGFGNKVTVPAGTLVAADGERGTGLLVSFGLNHVVDVLGEVRASGPSGIAARFDFGATYIGADFDDVKDAMVSYGTYLKNDCPAGEDCQEKKHEYIPIAMPGDQTNTTGPLVAQFNVQGRLIGGPSISGEQILSGESVDLGGRRVAVYIGSSAHVAEINFMKGAYVEGDILSRWDPAGSPVDEVRDNPETYMTELTFGRMVGLDGRTPVADADPDFRMDYSGNVTGPASLNVSLVGGTLGYLGTMAVRSFVMASGTTLAAGMTEGRGVVIDASSVDLAADSRISFSPSAFSYGGRLSASPTAVRFANAVPSVKPELDGTPGNFGIGPYDYGYGGISWSPDGSAVVIDVTGVSYNDSRGGTDAQNSPLPAILRTPGNVAVATRSMRLFPAAAKAQVANVGRNGFASGTGEFGRNGTVARSADSFRALSMNAEVIPELQWRSAGDGGWEAQDGRSGVWVAPSYGILDHHGRRGYRMEGPGVTFGADHRFSDEFFLGLALALDFPRIDSDDAKTRAWGTTGILYGGADLPLGLELGFSGFIGGMHYARERTCEGATHNSEFDSKIVGVGANLGRRFEATEDLVVRPFVSWEFDRVDQGSATEGDGVYALRYDGGTSTLHRLQAGADVAWNFGAGSVGGRVFWSGIRWENIGDSTFSFVRDRCCSAG